MAASSPPGHGRPDDGGGDRTPTTTDSLATAPLARLRSLAFWCAIVLPFLHVPLLTSGLATPGERRAFVALLGVNAVALYVGHGHGRE